MCFSRDLKRWLKWGFEKGQGCKKSKICLCEKKPCIPMSLYSPLGGGGGRDSQIKRTGVLVILFGV